MRAAWVPITVVAGWGAVAAPLMAQAIAAGEIRTAATASRRVPADLAVLTLLYSATGSTPAEAETALGARTDSIRWAFARVGVPADSLAPGSRWGSWPGRVGPFRISQWCDPRPDGRGCTPVADTGIRAEERLTARIHDMRAVEPALRLALALGVTEVQGPAYSVTDPADAVAAALRDASARARRHAEVLARGAGVRLGRVLSLDTSDRGNFHAGLETSSVNVSMPGAEGPGTLHVAPWATVTVTVYGRWEILERAR